MSLVFDSSITKQYNIHVSVSNWMWPLAVCKVCALDQELVTSFLLGAILAAKVSETCGAANQLERAFSNLSNGATTFCKSPCWCTVDDMTVWKPLIIGSHSLNGGKHSKAMQSWHNNLKLVPDASRLGVAYLPSPWQGRDLPRCRPLPLPRIATEDVHILAH